MTTKKDLTETDIRTKYIIPAIKGAGWDITTQVREEVYFTDGMINVKGHLSTRGKRRRADIILYYKPNIPIAVIEAKDNNKDLFLGEAADLMFHYLVLLATKDYTLQDVLDVLHKRHSK